MRTQAPRAAAALIETTRHAPKGQNAAPPPTKARGRRRRKEKPTTKRTGTSPRRPATPATPTRPTRRAAVPTDSATQWVNDLRRTSAATPLGIYLTHRGYRWLVISEGHGCFLFFTSVRASTDNEGLTQNSVSLNYSSTNRPGSRPFFRPAKFS